MTVTDNTTSGLNEKWNEAFERLKIAEATFREYCASTNPLVDIGNALLFRMGFLNDVHLPDFDTRLKAVKAENPAYFLTEAMEAELNRLARAVDVIEQELADTPAPHLAALEWKLSSLARDCFGWGQDSLALVYRDMGRLLGPPPKISGEDGLVS